MTDKSLFAVNIEVTIYVWAEDNAEAIDLATSYEAVRDQYWNDLAIPSQVTVKERIDSDWRNCIPYGAPNDETCDELFDLQYAEPEPEPEGPTP